MAQEEGRAKPWTKHRLKDGLKYRLLIPGWAWDLDDEEIEYIQEMLGHSSPTTTQIYTHITQAEARQSLLEHHPRAKS
jgi:integrase